MQFPQARFCSIARAFVPCGCCQLRLAALVRTCGAAASLIAALVVVARLGASLPGHAAAAAAGPQVTALLVVSAALMWGGSAAASALGGSAAVWALNWGPLCACHVALHAGAAMRMSRGAACRGWKWRCAAPRARQRRRAGGVVVPGGVGFVGLLWQQRCLFACDTLRILTCWKWQHVPVVRDASVCLRDARFEVHG